MNLLFKTDLLPHQENAVRKLAKLKVGALFMEQGTGKTRTMLEIIASKALIMNVIWLCPCSVKKNLQDDIVKHCGYLPDGIVIAGIESLSSSDSLYLKLRMFASQTVACLVVDESALCKNPLAIRSQRIIELSKLCPYRYILNGTPISRNEADLYSQFYILDWRILGYKSYYSFAANHLEYRTIKLPNGQEYRTNQVRRVLNTRYLTEKISPYTYQVKKSECLQLPDKKYIIEWCHLTVDQRAIYTNVKFEFLNLVDELRSDTIYRLFTALQHVASGMAIISSAKEHMQTAEIFNDIDDNPRIAALWSIIRNDIKDEKAIIFVKYKREASEVTELLRRHGLTSVLFTGDIPQRKRQENRNAFSGTAQFLIANKACGAFGLNMQFCRNIIFYSNDFNYATRVQAEDRVHRIGQEMPVRVYDICAVDTIDDFIRGNLLRKENLADSFRANIDLFKDKKWRAYGKNILEQKCIRRSS